MLLGARATSSNLRWEEKGEHEEEKEIKEKEERKRMNSLLRPQTEISDVCSGYFSPFFLPLPECPLPSWYPHTPMTHFLKSAMFQNYLLFFPQQTNSIFLVQLIYKQESNLAEPNHTKVRITDDHCTFLEVFFPPFFFLYLLFVCFQGVFTKVKAHPWLAFAPENSSPKLFLLHIIPSLFSLR